ncbi:MAG: hypothetical protein ING65_10125 [Rhodocyclaceae bacterium]|nr:hypothetical protein [Rhodocyclaceae bacterium]
MRRSARVLLIFLLVFPACSYAAPFWEKPSEEARLTPAEHRTLEVNAELFASTVAQAANLTIKRLTRLREDKDISQKGWQEVRSTAEFLKVEIEELEGLLKTQRSLLEERKKRRQGANAAGMYLRKDLHRVMQDNIISDDELSNL